MSVPANIRRLREAAGQTHAQVAEGSRMSEGVAYGLELGRQPQAWQIAAVARHFGVSEDEIRS